MRKQDIICVVENIRDVIAIESTQQFNGLYHVLGGIISPLDGVGPDQLQIESLVKSGAGTYCRNNFALNWKTYRATPPFIYRQKLKHQRL